MNIIAIMGPHNAFYKDEPMRQLHQALIAEGFEPIYPKDANDLVKLIEHNPRICGVIFDWDEYSLDLCSEINQLNEYLPLYAFINTHSTMDISINEMRMALWFFEYALGVAEDIAQRIRQYTDEYIENITPPLTRALFTYVKEGKYTFCTPGHMAGTAFQKSPVGTLFYDFYGPNTLKADTSISVTELGSLLDHTGPHLEAEEYIARTFGAEQSYMVTNGTSTSNKIVGMYAVPAGSTMLVDRNCHKSLTHLLMMSDIVPIWLKPTRNALGILGGIPKREFTRESIALKVAQTEHAAWPVHAVITNSTYDGLLYNTRYIKETLEVPSIHFDSAWVPYTNFHPIYAGKSGMSGERTPGKVIYETQSTHKLLAAFSQASLIHIKGDYDEQTFNEAYMMHTTTSPNYSIVASIETAAAMLRGNPGRRLINRSVERALHFRREIQRLREESDSWFFDIWQPDGIDEAECWPIQPGEEDWHGFVDADRDHMYLDPIKVTILTPGMSEQGEMAEEGIPAALVAKFLDERGIVVEKTGPYNLLFLFSIGIDKTRAMGLLRGLLDFKRAYDLNLRVKNILPDLYAEDPDFYRNMRIQTLAQGIHRLIRQHDLPRLMLKAFDVLPEMKMTPHQAFQLQVKGEVETVEIDQLIGRVSANMILPYPPGVPLVMPGEMITEASRPVLDFLLMLCAVGRHYPGFETDIHGARLTEEGSYLVRVLKQDEPAIPVGER
ncbi:Constitutive lysine decarboxylase [Mixta theicola]|nr:lysine decarboxylase LdcC [Mixta theicola]QHM76588.1 Constitutive lysine decarboxylase [Mixta theicola]